MAKYLDFAGLEYFASKIQAALNGRAATGHKHAAGDITSGTLPVARGGTGVTSNPSMLVNLASTTADTVLEASPRPGVTGTLPIANGGTGATSASAALTALGAVSKSGDTMTGDLKIANGTYTVRLRNDDVDWGICFADGDKEAYMGASGVGGSQECFSFYGSDGGTVKLSRIADPIVSTDAVNKGYADTNYMSATNPTGTGSLSINRKADTTVGNYSTALGTNCTASGSYSFAAGSNTTASSTGDVALGLRTTASGGRSLAGGSTSSVTGANSIAFGNGCETTAGSAVAFGSYCHATGSNSVALGNGAKGNGSSAIALGTSPEALDYQLATGHYNNTTNATAGTESGTGTGTAFVIGNGAIGSTSNAFRVTYDGKPYCKSSLTTTGCDYAEFFEWLDGNPEAEDRRGYFVTMDGEKIKKAEPGDYILGIISGQPSVIGNGDEDWMGRYIMDDFGAFIYETFEYEEDVIDEETGEVTGTIKKTGTKYKENPDYDPSKGYIQREDRPEWSAVGMLGVLSVWDDGTCEVNGYCKVAEGGTATKAETGYRVIKRVNDNIVKVIFR